MFGGWAGQIAQNDETGAELIESLYCMSLCIWAGQLVLFCGVLAGPILQIGRVRHSHI